MALQVGIERKHYYYTRPFIALMDCYKMVTRSSKSIKVGPWGGKGGVPWDDGSYSGVRSVTLTYGQCIDSIRVEYDKNGKSVLGARHGGNGGNRSIQVKFDYPEEYLTTVCVHVAPVVQGGSPVIRSLVLKSNRRSFGPFGAEEGTPFEFPVEEGKIVGFSGRSGRYLDAIGLHLSRLQCVNIHGTVQHKLQMMGSMAFRSLGNKDAIYRSQT